MSKRTDALRKLIEAFPSPPELQRAMHGLYEHPDHAVALMAPAMLDNLLERLLRTGMKCESGQIRNRLFEREGALRDFSSKISVATAFGLIPIDLHDQLQRVKRIRNVFAHAATPVTFDTPEISIESDGFALLEMIRALDEVKNDPRPLYRGKGGFIFVTTIFAAQINGLHVKAGGSPLYGETSIKLID